eukprot:1158200-Pelagomonas_calceolata.AAC.1
MVVGVHVLCWNKVDTWNYWQCAESFKWFHKGPGWGGFQGLDTHADSDVECRQASAAADAFSANLGRQRPCLSPLWPQGLTTC